MKLIFFKFAGFKKAFAVYNLGLVDLNWINTNLDQEALDYMKQKVLELNIRPLRTKQLNMHDSTFTFKKPEAIANRPETLFPNSSTYLISWPVFSKNGEFALIYELNRCGIDCGGGQINFFMKKGQGDWEKIGLIITSLH